MTSVTIRPSTASATTSTPAADTDYYLLTGTDDYSPAPYRKLLLHGQGTITRFGSGFRVTDIAGSWGYSDERVTSATTVASGLASDAAATTFVTSASPAITVGQTLLIGTEQVYLTGLSGTTATICSR